MINFKFNLFFLLDVEIVQDNNESVVLQEQLEVGLDPQLTQTLVRKLGNLGTLLQIEQSTWALNKWFKTICLFLKCLF